MTSKPRLDSVIGVKHIAYVKMVDKVLFGKKVKAARLRLRRDGRTMTHEDLAHEMGYRSRQAAGNWEKGVNLCEASKFNQLADVLLVPVEWLLDNLDLEHSPIPPLPPEAARPPEATQMLDIPSTIPIRRLAPTIVVVASVEAVHLSDPKGPALELVDRKGDRMAIPVDRSILESLQKCLDDLRQHV